MKGLNSTLLQVIPFILALAGIALAIKKQKISREEIGWNRPASRTSFLFWFLGYAVFVVFLELALYGYGLLEVSKWEYPIPVTIIRITGIVILAPLAEEILFRGILLSKFRKKGMNTMLAIAVQALIFLLLHAFAYENTLTSRIGIAQVFIDGCIFGFARIQSRSLFTSIAMHSFANAIAAAERLL